MARIPAKTDPAHHHVLMRSETDARALGAALAPFLHVGDVIGLEGPLGAGKTTLARGLIEAVRGAGDAPSPTYTLVETYDGGGLSIWHFDLYRLEKPSDVWDLGLEVALADGVCVIEWPHQINAFLPKDRLMITISIDGETRSARLSGAGSWARRIAILADQ